MEKIVHVVNLLQYFSLRGVSTVIVASVSFIMSSAERLQVLVLKV